MRSMSLFLSILLLCGVMAAQQKYLVSPNDEVIPLRRGESPRSIIAKRTGINTSSAVATCGTRFTFGYDEIHFPATSNFGARHKDVMGEWFVAKATGTVDTVFWETLGSVGALDSTLYLRIFNSRIGPTYGPGARPGPYGPPCQNWGYYVNTNDHDQGVAAFKEDATDTNWHSTIAVGPATLPPFTNVIWGFLGVAYTDHAGEINHAAMLDIGTPLNITVGQQFFLSQRVKGPDTHPDPLDGRTEFAAAGFHVDKSDESYPSRDWKFYEHDSGPSNCAGIPTALVKRGWVARGGFTDDSLDVALYNYWYSMSVTTNVPPDVTRIDILHNTFETTPQLFTADLVDCDPAVPTRAGVKKALVKWFVNNVTQPDLTMSYTGGDTWEATIPGEPVGSFVTYKVYVEDSTGLFQNSAPISYSVVQLSNGFVQVDTGGPCSPKSISATGTEIDTSKFFNAAVAAANTNKLDDGSAGPFDMGSNMPLFGDVARYVWVGINGGIAISKAATDTFDVNASGAYTTAWTFPQARTRHNGRADTANSATGLSRIPGNFFAALWADLWDGDATQKCGRILHQKGYGGDTCLFIVEWDSIGAFNGPTGQPLCDETTFRIVLNKCTGVIEYQYDNVGTVGEDSSASIGFEADSTAGTVPSPGTFSIPPYVFVNNLGYPLATRPRNGWCLKFYPATVNIALDGWNMLSVGVVPVGGNYSKTAVWPTAVSQAFSYNGAYIAQSTLANGPGYWAKFSGVQNVGSHGSMLYSQVIAVNNAWNMVGTISFPVPKATIIVGGGTVASNYFGYNGGYVNTLTLMPGQGYWVKMTGAGTLTMSGAPAAEPKAVPQTDMNTLNKITVVASAREKQTLYIGEESRVKEALAMYEMPPAAPEFDARFSSGRMVETYPAHLDAKAQYEYPIHITSDKAVTIQWNVVNAAERKLVLSANGKTQAILAGSGQVTLRGEDMKDVKVTLTDGVELPKVFALSQNYPNPFNPSTRFSMELPKTSEVEVVIYDILGRKIATLLNGEQTAGYHTIEWDGKDARGIAVPSGIYFARMSAGEVFHETRKIMLMK